MSLLFPNIPKFLQNMRHVSQTFFRNTDVQIFKNWQHIYNQIEISINSNLLQKIICSKRKKKRAGESINLTKKLKLFC